MKETTFLGIRGRSALPTRRHRPAVWEAILGTLYAQSPSGEIRYFDYNYNDAFSFAGISTAEDIRISRAAREYRPSGEKGFRKGHLVVFVKDQKGVSCEKN